MRKQSPRDEILHKCAITTVEIGRQGKSVGYFYRHPPDNDRDAGWCFLSGKETDAYMLNADNLCLVHVHHIVERHPEIEFVLRTPAPCAFTRGSDGTITRTADPSDDE